MIVLIGGEKGGTGKSTIATNLAVCLSINNEDVLLVDCDPQLTASKWVSRRSKNYPEKIQINSVQKTGNIFDSIKDLSKRYKNIIIDAGGRDSEELRSAMAICEKMYIPLKASQPDLETTKHLGQLIKLARSLNHKLDAYVVISMASTNPVLTEDKEAIELLNELTEIKVSQVIIRERKIYRDAIADGSSVIEHDNNKAKLEIESLLKEIFYEKE